MKNKFNDFTDELYIEVYNRTDNKRETINLKDYIMRFLE